MTPMLGLDEKNWGNLTSNLTFLERTGLLATPKRILEIGCGKGELLRLLRERGHDVAAIDADRDVVEQSPPELGVQLASGDALPFPDASFDLVLSFDVLEHIPDSDRHLREVRRVLKPGGHYLLQTPNKWTNIPFEMVRWSRSYGIRRMFDFLKPPQHCALHSYGALRRRFETHRFAVEFFDIQVVNDYFVNKVRTFLGAPGVALLKVANPDRLPRRMRTNFYVKAQMLA